MNSSIIKTVGITGKKKQADHENLAKLANVPVVRLQHPSRFGNLDISMKGFQGGVFEMMESRQGKTFEFSATKDRFGEDTAIPKPLIFAPDEETEQLLTVIPLTKFNKRFLARIYGKPHCPIILDADVDFEIRKMADEYVEEDTRRKTQAEIIAEQEAKILALEKLNTRRQTELRNLTKRQKVINSAIRESKESATTKAVEMFRKAIVDAVCEEKTDLVASLMERYDDKWEESDEYKEAIAPVVEERLAEKLKEEGLKSENNETVS